MLSGHDVDDTFKNIFFFLWEFSVWQQIRCFMAANNKMMYGNIYV